MKNEKIIYDMLTENTGINSLDSGGRDNRHWQRNQKLSLADFKNQPLVDLDTLWAEPTINIFKFLGLLPLGRDHFCHEFDRKNLEEADEYCNQFNIESYYPGSYDIDTYGIIEPYGITEIAYEWLCKKSFLPVSKNGTEYTYNYENFYSQDFQFQFLSGPNEKTYLLLQIHNGADARGGLTSARMFVWEGEDNDSGVPNFVGYLDVYGWVKLSNNWIAMVSTSYDGCRLTIERIEIDEEANEDCNYQDYENKPLTDFLNEIEAEIVDYELNLSLPY